MHVIGRGEQVAVPGQVAALGTVVIISLTIAGHRLMLQRIADTRKIAKYRTLVFIIFFLNNDHYHQQQTNKEYIKGVWELIVQHNINEYNTN